MNHKLYLKSGRNVGTIANDGTIEGISRVCTISEYLALSEGGFGPTSGKVGNIQMDLVQILAKLALSKGGSGPKLGKAGTIVHVGTIQGWIWAKHFAKLALSKGGLGSKFGKVGHYPRVDLGQNWTRLALSYMLALSKGGVGPKVVNPRNYRHFQGWIWTSVRLSCVAGKALQCSW